MLTERGDYILLEEYTFSSAAETAFPLGLKGAPIKMDEQGLQAESMDEVLSNWDEAARGARKPFVLYTIATGQNPTGATQSGERRKAIYKVAQKHDVIIVEDEPYYFLQMQPYTDADGSLPPPPATHDEFIQSLIPSYLSMDVDGRVLRLESFSKVVSPGSRVGWIVGCEQLIERFIRNCEVSAQNPSGISQIVLFKLLDEHWGHSGYLDWLINMRMQYTNRRNSLVGACEKFLPTEIAHWVPPAAGMFVSPCLYTPFSLPPYQHPYGSAVTDHHSTGSKSIGRNTQPSHPARPATRSKGKSSMPRLTTACWSRAAAGSRRKARGPRRRCSSGLLLRQPVRIRLQRQSNGLEMRCEGSLGCLKEWFVHS